MSGRRRRAWLAVVPAGAMALCLTGCMAGLQGAARVSEVMNRLGPTPEERAAAMEERIAAEQAEMAEEGRLWLEERYGEPFIVHHAVFVSNSPGPIPDIFATEKDGRWEVKAESVNHPGKTFTATCRYREKGGWTWADNYYSVLYRQTAEVFPEETPAEP